MTKKGLAYTFLVFALFMCFTLCPLSVFADSTYTVSYDANGGDGTMNDSVYTYGTEQALRENTFTKTGYTFKGWARTADGEAEYSDGEVVKDIKPRYGDEILPNVGFENCTDGIPDGWGLQDVWKTDNIPYVVNDAERGNYIYSDTSCGTLATEFPTEPGDSVYILEFDYKSMEDKQVAAVFSYFDTTTSSWTSAWGEDIPAAAEWTRYSNVIVLSGGNFGDTTGAIFLYNKGDGLPASFDNVSLRKVYDYEQIVSCGENIMTNGDLENEEHGWDLREIWGTENPAPEIATENGNSFIKSEYACGLMAKEVWGLETKGNVAYIMEFDYKLEENSTASAQLLYSHEGWSYTTVEDSYLPPAEDWTHFSNIYIIDGEDRKGTVMSRFYHQADGLFAVDNVSIRRVFRYTDVYNLVDNPSFEGVLGDEPNKWTLSTLGAAGTEPVLVTSDASAEEASIFQQGWGGRITQTIPLPVNPTESYILEFDYKQNEAGHIWTKVENARGDILVDKLETEVSDDWTRARHEIDFNDYTGGRAKITLTGRGLQEDAYFYIDNVSLKPASKAAPQTEGNVTLYAVWQENDDNVIIEVQDASAPVSGQIEVKINMTYTGRGGGFNILYDNYELTYVDNSFSIITDSITNSQVKVDATQPGRIHIVFLSDNTNFIDEEVFSFKFNTNTLSCSTNIIAQANEHEFLDSAYLPINPDYITYIPGAVNVQNMQLSLTNIGDVSGIMSTVEDTETDVVTDYTYTCEIVTPGTSHQSDSATSITALSKNDSFVVAQESISKLSESSIVVITPQTTSVIRGQEAEVKINLTHAGNGGGFNIIYDTESLTYIPNSFKSLVSSIAQADITLNATVPGTIGVSFTASAMNISNTAAFSLKFTATDDFQGALKNTTVSTESNGQGFLNTVSSPIAKEPGYGTGIVSILSEYNVFYNANGGNGSMEKSLYVYDVTQALSKNTFTKEGYIFKGWAKSADGNVIYTDEANVKNICTKNGEDVTLYAVWRDLGTSYEIKSEFPYGKSSKLLIEVTVTSGYIDPEEETLLLNNVPLFYVETRDLFVGIIDAGFDIDLSTGLDIINTPSEKLVYGKTTPTYNNEIIGLTDLIMLKRIILGHETSITDNHLIAGDVANGESNGLITTADYGAIARIVLEKDDELLINYN